MKRNAYCLMLLTCVLSACGSEKNDATVNLPVNEESDRECYSYKAPDGSASQAMWSVNGNAYEVKVKNPVTKEWIGAKGVLKSADRANGDVMAVVSGTEVTFGQLADVECAAYDSIKVVETLTERSGSCVGTPTQCVSLSSAQCSLQLGCKFKAASSGSCSGYTQSCYSQFSSSSCSNLRGCYWSYSGNQCNGVAVSCYTQYSESSCTGLSSSCYWTADSSSCEGASKACSSFDNSKSCVAQVGCSWK